MGSREYSPRKLLNAETWKGISTILNNFFLKVGVGGGGGGARRREVRRREAKYQLLSPNKLNIILVQCRTWLSVYLKIKLLIFFPLGV